MLFLLFRIGNEQYVIDVKSVVEVIPKVLVRNLPGVPSYITGLFNYRGTPVPVIDLGILTTGINCVEKLSTRIILVKYKQKDETEHILGLIAEAVMDTFRKELSEFMPVDINLSKSPFLGKVTYNEDGIIQNIIPERLLTSEVEKALFTETTKQLT